MGQIGKGGTRVRLGVGVLEHQRWTGFSRRSLLGYLHNYRSGVFQNREDWCIWLGHFTLQFVWHSGPGLWCGRGERGIIPHRSFEQRPVHVWLDNSTTTRGMRSAMGSKCSYDRGLFDGSIGGFLFEKSSEFVVERLSSNLCITEKVITYTIEPAASEEGHACEVAERGQRHHNVGLREGEGEGGFWPLERENGGICTVRMA
ncbi:uncharacterized protein BDCG_17315 [Blastomyces dermatitidis ER-3]|uniref:Uncharacterized protein n=2 Tax=Ajellomyces dermatitidis (strain ER-3 / ATCC MYA-2586) TaxID=559297 RepID=A0ABX2VXT5_AJEDR|nr:uncharacterized protein BDCG_17315 [Blastomyces dermatitidis ER-3]OAT01964.1 hypothetical protein BDCG_17315 [Blastomyces dermatitidis ER-3]